ncbi:hypothetical protein [Bacillus sp. AFS041924]|uniref:hypothetical protein n=1 Tax=Bacillus sp. AFS041924 TaxID=2033503 RepID=UPI000BFC4F30|nr:hypothetical protein [Bacillus sp. AFS041924]PGS52668.1 hypothetical protein COC46_09435 [Bacillus sp. AFS041924]
MRYKKQRQLGIFFVIFGVLVLFVSSLAYFKFSSTISTDPYTIVRLDLSNKGTKKTTDLIYLKQNEKNGIPIEIKHSLKNIGNRDIAKITLDSQLRQKSGRNEGQYICIRSIKYGDQLYTLKSLKFLGLDLNKDGKISLVEFSRRPFQLGSLNKGKEREFVLNGEFRKGLAPFTRDNQSARVILDISYKIE